MFLIIIDAMCNLGDCITGYFATIAVIYRTAVLHQVGSVFLTYQDRKNERYNSPKNMP